MRMPHVARLFSAQPARAFLFASAIAYVIAVRAFVQFAPVRLKLIEARQSATGGIFLATVDDASTQPHLRPPLALILRASSEHGDQRLTVTIDGVDVCRPLIGGFVAKRIDCAIRSWGSGTRHELAI